MRVKIAEHEFEAEGPPEVVERYFDAFQTAIIQAKKSIPYKPPDYKDHELADKYDEIGECVLPWPFTEYYDAGLGRKVVKLEEKPPGKRVETQAALLLLWALDIVEMGDLIKVTQLRSSMTLSGYEPERIDRTLEPYLEEGWVRRQGKGKAARYGIEAEGGKKAQELMKIMKDRSGSS